MSKYNHKYHDCICSFCLNKWLSLTVITNSIDIAYELSSRKDSELIVTCTYLGEAIIKRFENIGVEIITKGRDY